MIAIADAVAPDDKKDFRIRIAGRITLRQTAACGRSGGLFEDQVTGYQPKKAFYQEEKKTGDADLLQPGLPGSFCRYGLIRIVFFDYRLIWRILLHTGKFNTLCLISDTIFVRNNAPDKQFLPTGGYLFPVDLLYVNKAIIGADASYPEISRYICGLLRQ